MFISTEVQVIVQRINDNEEFKHELLSFNDWVVSKSKWADHVYVLKKGKFNLIERLYLKYHIAKAQRHATKTELMRVILGLESPHRGKEQGAFQIRQTQAANLAQGLPQTKTPTPY